MPDPQISLHLNKADVTAQMCGTARKSPVAEAYCDLCRRTFGNENALRMHVQNAKVHKKGVTKQKESAQAPHLKSALQPTLGVAAQSFGIPAPETTSTYFLQSQAGYATNLPMQTLADLYLQSQTDCAPAAHMPGYLWQSHNLANENFQPQYKSTTANSNTANLNQIFKSSVIPTSQQPAEFETLSKHCHPSEELLKYKYLTRPYAADDIAGLCRCRNCDGLQKDLKLRAEADCFFHPGEQKPTMQGKRLYFCCGRTGPGCTSLPGHVYHNPDGQLGQRYREFKPTPTASHQLSRRRAVALDCEMANVQGGMREVTLLCAADYLTGEILINTLVSPTKRVIDWRSEFSGVTPSAMAAAESRGETLKGWKRARSELWNYIDNKTILVGHSLQHDLDVLRMIHTRVVDSAILTKNAVGTSKSRQWGLKALCDELLDIEIQNHGSMGHNCLEDTLAAREVVLWCCRNPERLKEWGALVRKDEKENLKKQKQKSKERKRKQQEKKGKSQGKKSIRHPESSRPNAGGAWGGYYPDSESEVLHWSDIAEDCGWPHPDTGYDPWSD